VETTLVEYLCSQGFDVWVVEGQDYPAALAVVSAEAGVEKVHAVAHGAAAPALLANGLPTLASVVCIGGPLQPKLGVTPEPCNNEVCRRIAAVHGRLFEHAQLNPATHETLHELYGLAGGLQAASTPGSVDIPLSYIYGAADPRVPPDHVQPVPGYGHVDLLIGANAAQEVFPLILQHLRETANPAEKTPG